MLKPNNHLCIEMWLANVARDVATLGYNENPRFSNISQNGSDQIRV